jgi:hypothetical protein
MLRLLGRAAARRLFLAGTCVVAASCGSGGNSSILGPSAATPISSVSTYTLPGDAPPDAAAPAGTTRIAFTTVTFIAPDGTRVSPSALKVGVKYQLQVWAFCPTGLGGGGFSGTIDVAVTVGKPFEVAGGGEKTSLVIPSGYFHIDGGSLLLAFKASEARLHAEIIRNFAVIATIDVPLVFS